MINRNVVTTRAKVAAAGDAPLAEDDRNDLYLDTLFATPGRERDRGQIAALRAKGDQVDSELDALSWSDRHADRRLALLEERDALRARIDRIDAEIDALPWSRRQAGRGAALHEERADLRARIRRIDAEVDALPRLRPVNDSRRARLAEERRDLLAQIDWLTRPAGSRAPRPTPALRRSSMSEPRPLGGLAYQVARGRLVYQKADGTVYLMKDGECGRDAGAKDAVYVAPAGRPHMGFARVDCVADDDPDDRRKLILQNGGLVISLAFERRYAEVARARGIPLEDLTQAGMVGLCRAADQHDPARGPWGAFATMHITRAMLQFLRSHIRHAPTPFDMSGWGIGADFTMFAPDLRERRVVVEAGRQRSADDHDPDAPIYGPDVRDAYAEESAARRLTARLDPNLERDDRATFIGRNGTVPVWLAVDDDPLGVEMKSGPDHAHFDIGRHDRFRLDRAYVALRRLEATDPDHAEAFARSFGLKDGRQQTLKEIARSMRRTEKAVRSMIREALICLQEAAQADASRIENASDLPYVSHERR